MRKIAVFLVLSMTVISLCATDVVIKRDRSVMRKGPGSYYTVLKELALNTRLQLLSQTDSWYNVLYEAQNGFVSVSATKAQPPRKDIFAGMQAKPGTTVNQHSISAGVKGFAAQFNKQFKGSDEFILYVMDQSLDPVAFEEFLNNTYQDVKPSYFTKRIALPERIEPDYYAEAAEGFGLSLASVIAQQGLYNEPNLLRYINQVGCNLVSCSDVPDITFKFFILDIDAPNAYACPGGIVFITRGMLRLMDSEADLAFILAHEIAHVSRFHGIKEARQQVNQIAAESVFDELDIDTEGFSSSQNIATEKELEQDMTDMFNDLIAGRLDKYELQADSLGLLYSARAGYDSGKVKDIFSRIYASQTVSNNEHYRKDSIMARLKAIGPVIDKYTELKLNFFNHRDRWQKLKSNL